MNKGVINSSLFAFHSEDTCLPKNELYVSNKKFIHNEVASLSAKSWILRY